MLIILLLQINELVKIIPEVAKISANYYMVHLVLSPMQIVVKLFCNIFIDCFLTVARYQLLCVCGEQVSVETCTRI